MLSAPKTGLCNLLFGNTPKLHLNVLTVYCYTHTKKSSLISSTIIRNPLPAVSLEYISLINDLIKNTCGIMKGVIFVPFQSNTFYLGASESSLSDIVQNFKGTFSANKW